MSDKELIKQEIERMYKEAKSVDCFTSSVVETTLERLRNFIDSLPEEPASEDIENEIERFVYSLPHSADGFWPKDIDCYSQEARTKYGVSHAWSYEQVMNIARHFAE